MRSSQNFMTIIAALFAVLVLAGCGKDDTANTSCTFDLDCELGTVCQVQDKECIVAACEFCTAEQICYKPTPDSAGSCSAPQCTTDAECTEGACRNGVCSDGGCVTAADCGDGEVCNLAGVCEAGDGTCAGDADCPSGEVCTDDVCVAGCATDEECEAGEFCNAQNTCETGCRDSMECPSGQVCGDDGACSCDATSCPDGKVCLDTGNCGNPTDCAQVDCGAQVCNPANLMCQDRCTADSCMANEICAPSGLCEVNNCPGEDPTQCAGNAQRPIWDPIKCFCAECTGDADCPNAAAGETCNAAGSCFLCQTACDAGTPGTCQGTTPYCISDCCVECVGAADCAQGELCLDGFCGQPPNCQVDPTVCPSGYTCNQGTGQCDSPNSGGMACDPMDPTSCPGSFCDPTTSMCGGIGGGLGCGLCNPDCTCDGGLTCDGFFCSGCDPVACLIGVCSCVDPVLGCLPLGANGEGICL